MYPATNREHASPSGAILPENHHFPRTERQRDQGGCLVKLNTPETGGCQLQVDASTTKGGSSASDPQGAKEESFTPDQAVSSTANPELPKGASLTCNPHATSSTCGPDQARRVSTKLDFLEKTERGVTSHCSKGLPFCETLPTIDSPGSPDKGVHWVHTSQGCSLSEHRSGCKEGCESGSHPLRGAHSMVPLEGVDETDTPSPGDRKGRGTGTPLAGGKGVDTANTHGPDEMDRVELKVPTPQRRAITLPPSDLPVHEMGTKASLGSGYLLRRASSACTKGMSERRTLSRFTPDQRRERVRQLISTRVAELELSLVACYRLGLNPLRSEVL